MKALVDTFHQEKALVGAFSVIVKSSQTFVKPKFQALMIIYLSSKSCGNCDGDTPLPTNDCADRATNCAELAKDYCYQTHIASACCKSCGLGNIHSA